MIKDPTGRLPLSKRLRNRLRHLTTRHRQGEAHHVFICSIPRSGSTWLAELIATQGRFKVVNEPFNLRRPVVRETLGFDDWALLLDPASKPTMRPICRCSSMTRMRIRDSSGRFRSPSNGIHDRPDALQDPVCSERTIRLVPARVRRPDPAAPTPPDTRLAVARGTATATLVPRGPFAARFTASQRALARRVVNSAVHFEMAVLDWCLQNAVPLRGVDPSWVVVSYEQMVLDPGTVVAHLTQRLSLPEPARMLKRLGRASASTVKSSAESRRLLQRHRNAPEAGSALIGRWRGRVTLQEEARAFDIVEAFEIDYYLRGSLTPNPKWLLSAPRRQAP